jgi:hypothetical protein
MEIAKMKDSLEQGLERDWPHKVAHVPFPFLRIPTHTILRQKSDDCAPTMTVNFVLLRSPLLSLHDPETITVSREHRFIWCLL